MIKTLLCFVLMTTCVFSLEGVVQLTDSNFAQKVQSEPKFWIVMFSASWCGHCTNLKPEIEKLVPMLEELGASVGHVDENNEKLVSDHVVDHKTHMVSYPKLKVFLGEELMGDVPPGMRNAQAIFSWFKQNYNLAPEQEL